MSIRKIGVLRAAVNLVIKSKGDKKNSSPRGQRGSNDQASESKSNRNSPTRSPNKRGRSFSGDKGGMLEMESSALYHPNGEFNENFQEEDIKNDDFEVFERKINLENSTHRNFKWKSAFDNSDDEQDKPEKEDGLFAIDENENDRDSEETEKSEEENEEEKEEEEGAQTDMETDRRANASKERGTDEAKIVTDSSNRKLIESNSWNSTAGGENGETKSPVRQLTLKKSLSRQGTMKRASTLKKQETIQKKTTKSSSSLNIKKREKSIEYFSDSGSGSEDEEISQIKEVDLKLRHDPKYRHAQCLIYPDDGVKQFWDLYMTSLLFYMCTFVPYRIAFIAEENSDDSFGWDVVDRISDASFGFDLLLNFFSAIFDKHENLIIEKRKIIKIYLSGWFIIDLLAVLPLDYMLDSNRYNNLVRVARLPRLYKLVKIAKFLRIFRIMKDKNNIIMNLFRTTFGFRRLLVSIISMMVFCHLASCFWFMAADLNDDTISTWIIRFGYADKGNAERYFASFYWVTTTVVTVGYGDIYAQNEVERMMAISLMVVGVIFYSFFIGSLSSILSEIDSHKVILDNKVNILNEIKKEYAVNEALANKVKRALVYGVKRAVQDKKDFLNELPPNLKTELSYLMHRNLVNGLSFFKNKPARFIAYIGPFLKPLRVGGNEFISTKGEHANEMYFLKYGVVSVVLKEYENFPFMSIAEGYYFGELDILFGDTRQFSYFTDTDCEVLTLSKKYFSKIFFHEFREIGSELYRNALRRRKRLHQTMEEAIKYCRDHPQAISRNYSPKKTLRRHNFGFKTKISSGSKVPSRSSSISLPLGVDELDLPGMMAKGDSSEEELEDMDSKGEEGSKPSPLLEKKSERHEVTKQGKKALYKPSFSKTVVIPGPDENMNEMILSMDSKRLQGQASNLSAGQVDSIRANCDTFGDMNLLLDKSNEISPRRLKTMEAQEETKPSVAVLSHSKTSVMNGNGLVLASSKLSLKRNSSIARLNTRFLNPVEDLKKKNSDIIITEPEGPGVPAIFSQYDLEISKSATVKKKTSQQLSPPSEAKGVNSSLDEINSPVTFRTPTLRPRKIRTQQFGEEDLLSRTSLKNFMSSISKTNKKSSLAEVVDNLFKKKSTPKAYQKTEGLMRSVPEDFLQRLETRIGKLEASVTECVSILSRIGKSGMSPVSNKNEENKSRGTVLRHFTHSMTTLSYKHSVSDIRASPEKLEPATSKKTGAENRNALGIFSFSGSQSMLKANKEEDSVLEVSPEKHTASSAGKMQQNQDQQEKGLLSEAPDLQEIAIVSPLRIFENRARPIARHKTTTIQKESFARGGTATRRESNPEERKERKNIGRTHTLVLNKSSDNSNVCSSPLARGDIEKKIKHFEHVKKSLNPHELNVSSHSFHIENHLIAKAHEMTPVSYPRKDDFLLEN